ncbi:MAG: adenine deaminase C-terminal domain-containing protein, partial [Candidatus Bipolaricaulota bacterium]|nr:adenine deaminase C-terminal domain-containing protein [Candidatus Bipolaricaulota bacterium]
MQQRDRVRLKELKSEIRGAYDREPLDLLVKDVQLVNVHSGEIVTTNIGIKNGRVVTISPSLPKRTPLAVIDAEHNYAIPGLIDAHVHIETTLLTPPALAAVIVPHGTTTMLIDPMEISNVAGLDGLLAFIEGIDRLPYRIFIEVSSRVPTAPGLETTGGTLGLAETERLLDLDAAVSLGELDPAKIDTLSDEHLLKIIAAHRRGKIANGHAIGIDGASLQAYATAGLNDDHECVTFDELQARLALGMGVMVREGSSERNVDVLISGVVEHGTDTRNLMFCTDDKHTSDIRSEGHINYNVNRAIELGLDPMQAIQMATLNTAQHFHIEHLLGSITPGRYADFILAPSIERIEPERVFVNGRLVAQGGQLVVEAPHVDYPNTLRHTVKLHHSLVDDDFTIPGNGYSIHARVIDLVPGQIVNNEIEAMLVVKDGIVLPDVDHDVLPIFCVERYGVNGNIGRGLIHGFGLKHGAIAGSVSHDHHNIVVVGIDKHDMRVAVEALVEAQGGFVVVNDGAVQAILPLPLCGLMSEEETEVVDRGLSSVREEAHALGCPLETPFMALSFVSLPT